MTNPTEIVARAICCPTTCCLEGSRVVKCCEHEYWNEAEAVVRRLSEAGYVLVRREPSEAMINAGESAASFGIGKPTSDDAIPRVWEWMIEASLSEREDGE